MIRTPLPDSVRAQPEMTAPSHLPRLGADLLVALDVDGTIVTHNGECFDDVFHAIRRVADSGAHIVIATGRGPVSALPVIEMLEIRNGFAVCSNGAITLRIGQEFDGGAQVVDAVTFPPENTLRTLRDLLPTALFMVEDGHAVRRVTAPFPPGEIDGHPEVVDFEELMLRPASRITMRAPDMEREDVHGLLLDAGLHGVSYAVGWTAWVDVAPAGISKASALDRVRQHLQISPFATVAVGDGQNDHEMLEWASWSVAMGQAWPETRMRANVIAPSVDEGGLAHVLNSLR